MNKIASVAILVVGVAALTGLGVWIAMGGLSAQTEVLKDNLNGPKSLRTEKDFVDKSTELKMRRDKIKNGITQLKRKQTQKLQMLKDKGITKVADAQDDPEAKTALNEIKNQNQSIEKFESEVKLLDTAISRLDGKLAQFKRENLEKSVGLTEDQVLELMAIQNRLDEELGITDNNILEDMELDELLGNLQEDQ